MATTTAPADALVVVGRTAERGGRRDPERVTFADHGAAQVTVTRTEGTDVLWFTTDGSAPTAPGTWRWRVPAGPAPVSVVAPVPVPGTAVVRLYAEGAVEYEVRPL